MNLTKDLLNKRICDVEGGSNEQTYLQYIRELEDEVGILHEDVFSMSDEERSKYLDFLDELLWK